jgi:hypothetical protein
VLNAGRLMFRQISLLLLLVRGTFDIFCSSYTWLKVDIAFGALFDYELSLLPITILWHLKVDIKRKVGLYVLLGASVL